MRVPILRGPLRGSWWLLESRGKIMRVVLGTYEPEQTRLAQVTVRTGQTVIDIGAHAGYYSLLFSSLTGDSGAVWAFEPDPRNYLSLEQHVRINKRSNVTSIRAAVGSSSGVARFLRGGGSGTGKLSNAGELEVQLVRLDDVCRERDIRPDVIKIDVEGAEVEVLEGGREAIDRFRPSIFISTHGPEVHRSAIDFLQDAGYQLRPIAGASLLDCTEILASPGNDHARR